MRSHDLRQLELVPFAGGEYSNVSTHLAIIKVLGNIVLFIPFGISLPFLTKGRIWYTLVGAFVVSVVVEALQFLMSSGTSTTGDVLLNTIGALFGAILARIASDTLSNKFRPFS